MTTSSGTITTRATQVVNGKLYCKCALEAHRFVSHTDKNPNRAFWRCPKDRDDPTKCDLYKWEDELTGLAGQPQTPRKSGSQSTPGSSSVKANTNMASPQTPATPRYVPPTTPDEKEKARVARKAMIAKGIAEQSGGRSTPSSFKPKKEVPITPSQSDWVEVVVLSDDDEDPSANRKSKKNAYEIEVDDEGSPKKKQKTLPSQKGKSSQWDAIKDDEASYPCLLIFGPNSPFHAKNKQLWPTAPASQASSAAQVESALVPEPETPAASTSTSSPFKETSEEIANKVSERFKTYERKLANANKAAELRLRKMQEVTAENTQLKTQNQDLVKEKNGLEERVRLLETRNRGLEEELQHFKTGVVEID